MKKASLLQLIRLCALLAFVIVALMPTAYTQQPEPAPELPTEQLLPAPVDDPGDPCWDCYPGDPTPTPTPAPVMPVSKPFYRLQGFSGYEGQTFYTAYENEFGGFGRFQLASPAQIIGYITVGAPYSGQVALHRWSTRRGWYYSIYYANHGGDYVYGGIAGYVFPAGDFRGVPMHQSYSSVYGHYYATNTTESPFCQTGTGGAYDPQGEMGRLNSTGTSPKACNGGILFPPPPDFCNNFERAQCQQAGRFYDNGLCRCF